MNAVQELVKKIEVACNEKGYKLSRWQANGGGFTTTITYAVHTGERFSQFRLQPDESIIGYVKLNNKEGVTEKCEAYRKLMKLLAKL